MIGLSMNRLFTGRIDHDDSCGGVFIAHYDRGSSIVRFEHSGKLLYATNGLHLRLAVTDYSNAGTDHFRSYLWIS
jgi:hypothetical protein